MLFFVLVLVGLELREKEKEKEVRKSDIYVGVGLRCWSLDYFHALESVCIGRSL